MNERCMWTRRCSVKESGACRKKGTGVTRWMFVNVTGRFRRRRGYLIRNMRSTFSLVHNCPYLKHCLEDNTRRLLQT